jgi:Lon protease-like protein
VSVSVPMFPLSTVLFPGVTVPLHVFEDRYRALVHHLLTIQDKTERVFGIVAIREGYEVGSHGVQSVHRIGCLAQMTSVAPHTDGRFDIEVVGRQRLRVDAMDTSGPYLEGEVELLTDERQPDARARHEAERAHAVFDAYRQQLAEIEGAEPLTSDLPTDPVYLSYALAATCPLTLQQRQALLEVDTSAERLVLLRHSLQQEMQAMRVIPSLPATEVARTGWSPN